MPDDGINLFGVPWYGFLRVLVPQSLQTRLSNNFNRAFTLTAIAPPAARDEQCVPAACTVVAAYLLNETRCQSYASQLQLGVSTVLGLSTKALWPLWDPYIEGVLGH